MAGFQNSGEGGVLDKLWNYHCLKESAHAVSLNFLNVLSQTVNQHNGSVHSRGDSRQHSHCAPPNQHHCISEWFCYTTPDTRLAKFRLALEVFWHFTASLSGCAGSPFSSNYTTFIPHSQYFPANASASSQHLESLSHFLIIKSRNCQLCNSQQH